MRTASVSDWGQFSTAASGVLDQGNARIMAPISPPPARAAGGEPETAWAAKPACVALWVGELKVDLESK